MKKKTFISMTIFLTISLAALFVSAFAWFIMPGNYSPSFSAQVVRSYFDNSSGDSAGTEEKPFIITKPVHLYNLSYLQNKGVFSDKTYYFQLGKKKSMIDASSTDTGYYVYSSNLSDETSNTDLTSTDIDMTQYNSGIIQPIGYNPSTSFISVFKGNDISISNLTIQPTETMNNIGVFGYIGDNSSIENFNLDNLVINTPVITSADSDTVGLVVGYMNASTSSSIRLEGIGVKDSTINGKRKAGSLFSLVGGGSEEALTGLKSKYNTTASDTGVMSADNMYDILDSSSVTESFEKNFYGSGSYYNNQNAWIGSEGDTSFGIFNLTTSVNARTLAFGPLSVEQTSINYFSYDYSSLPITRYFHQDYGTSVWQSVALGSDNAIAHKFIEPGSTSSSPRYITSVSNSLYFKNSINYKSTFTANDYGTTPNNTATKFTNALFFEIHNPNGGEINFICDLPATKTYSRNNRSIGLWSISDTSSGGSSTSDGYISSQPSIFKFYLDDKSTSSATASPYANHLDYCCAFSFSLPQGKYLIGGAQNGIYFNYVSVSGTGGSSGGDASGIPLDFISALTQRVWSASYIFSGVAFTIAENNDETFKIKFVRNQYDDPISHVNVTGTFNNATVTIYSSSINSSLYTIADDGT